MFGHDSKLARLGIGGSIRMHAIHMHDPFPPSHPILSLPFPSCCVLHARAPVATLTDRLNTLAIIDHEEAKKGKWGGGVLPPPYMKS